MNGIIKIGIYKVTLFAILLIGSSMSYAATPQTSPDNLVYSLYFRQGGDLLMRDYRGNQQVLLAMDSALATENAPRILKINIVGTASPEGSRELNNRLALRRAKSIRAYILWRWGSAYQPLIEIDTHTDYLSAWIQAVENDPAVPRRDTVLEILHSKGTIQTKWANIQLLKGGASSYMERAIFPQLRNVVACMITFKEGKVATEELIQQKVTPPATEKKREEKEEKAVEKGVTDEKKIAPADTTVTTQPIESKHPSPEEKETTKTPSPEVRNSNVRFAIKTNLLQGAVAYAPNVGVEYALTPQSTIELSGALNHWGLKGTATNNKKLAHWIIQTEYRYWLKSSFNGHFFGIHALGGNYNISGHNLPNLFLGSKLMDDQYRYDGWTIGAGVSYGYLLRLAQRWGLEFTIGIGVAHLQYDKYDCVRCGRKLSTESNTYLGPTKAGISLVYNF